MNIIDIAIILIILAFGVLGAKRGVFEELVTTVGFVLVVVIAYILKTPIAEWMCVNLPFIKFHGLLNQSSFNILFYQVIAFLIVVIFLEVILQALIRVTGFIEKVLKFTIILGIPSKILGFIVGLVEGFVITFLLLFLLKQPAFDIKLFDDSKLTMPILNSTPILSNIGGGFVSTIEDTYKLIDDYDNEKIDNNTLELESIDVLLKHKIVSKGCIKKLVDKGKINLTGIDKVLNRY